MAKYVLDLGQTANRELEDVARQQGMSEAELIRRAVARYVVQNKRSSASETPRANSSVKGGERETATR